MARSAARAGVAGARDFGDGRQSAGSNLVLDRAFGNEEAGADQGFVTGPIVAGGIAVIADRGEQRVARETGTVFVVRNDAEQRRGLLSNYGRFSRRESGNTVRQ